MVCLNYQFDWLDTPQALELRLYNLVGDELRLIYQPQIQQLILKRHSQTTLALPIQLQQDIVAALPFAPQGLQLQMILDTNSIEIFIDRGLAVITALWFSSAPLTHCTVVSEEQVYLSMGSIGELSSIWHK